MPKPKPDQVIRHEIVLGRADRELLTDAVTAYQVNKVATPIVNLLNDNTSLLVIAGLLEAFGVIDVIPNWMMPALQEGVYATYEELLVALEAAGELKEDVEKARKNPAVKAVWWIYRNMTPLGMAQEIVT